MDNRCKITDNAWDTGELGRDADYVAVASEAEHAAIEIAIARAFNSESLSKFPLCGH